MTLHDLIASEPANAARTDAEVLDWLSEFETVPDPTPVTTKTVMARLVPSDAEEVFRVIVTAAAASYLVNEALILLRSTGLDVSHENARAMIDTLFPEEPLRGKVKALGERQAARSEAAGYLPRDLSEQIAMNARAV